MTTTESITQTTTLVISFGAALRAMLRGELTVTDLDNAVFYMGCTSDYAFRSIDDNGIHEELRFSNYTEEERDTVYTQFMEKVLIADNAGRVAWREECNTWEQLNGLLASCDLPLIQTKAVRDDYAAYCYPQIAEIVDEQQLPYKVTWY